MLQKKLERGELSIFNDVIIIITEIALTEIDGIFISSTSIKEKLLEKVKRYNNSIQIRTNNSEIMIDVKVGIAYGKNIPTIIQKLQQVIKENVEIFTGFTVNEVNVTVNQIVYEV